MKREVIGGEERGKGGKGNRRTERRGEEGRGMEREEEWRKKHYWALIFHWSLAGCTKVKVSCQGSLEIQQSKGCKRNE